MRFEHYEFGSIRVDGRDGATYDHDLVIDGGEIRGRKKGPSRELRARYGHTPLSIQEDIPWNCRRLVIGRSVGTAMTQPPQKRVQAPGEGYGVPRLAGATVHVDPDSHPGESHHTELSHDRRDRLARTGH